MKDDISDSDVITKTSFTAVRSNEKIFYVFLLSAMATGIFAPDKLHRVCHRTARIIRQCAQAPFPGPPADERMARDSRQKSSQISLPAREKIFRKGEKFFAEMRKTFLKNWRPTASVRLCFSYGWRQKVPKTFWAFREKFFAISEKFGGHFGKIWPCSPGV